MKFFRNPEDTRGVEIEFEGKGKIGEGYFAHVFRVQATVRRGVRSKIKHFAYKNYRPPQRENSGAAWANYHAARKEKLKVPRTYRISQDHSSILMTLFDGDDYVCVGSNKGSDRLESFGLSKKAQIEKFEDFVDAFFAHAIRAGEAGIFVRGDAYFFLVNKTGNTVQFIMGDFDGVSKRKAVHAGFILRDNLFEARRALECFIRANMQDDHVSQYLQTVQAEYCSWMTGQELWNI